MGSGYIMQSFGAKSGCTFDHLSSFLPLRTASVVTDYLRRNPLEIPSCLINCVQMSRGFPFALFIQKPPGNLVLCFARSQWKRAFPKALRSCQKMGRGAAFFIFLFIMFLSRVEGAP